MLNQSNRRFDPVPAMGSEFVRFDTMMKAMPSEEGGKRLIYVEASKESRDQQGEIVLGKALQESVGVFLKFGVLDIDHKSMPSVAKKYGIEHPELWEIGRPADVRFVDGVTIVKAELRQGDSPLAERANLVWDGLTKVIPPDRYYASVGGAVEGKETRIDPNSKSRVEVITKVRWNNLALSRNPVHPDLSTAGTTPIGTFAKSLNGLVLKNVITAGYGSDSASLTGGAALRMQSLDGVVSNYFEFRDRLSSAITGGETGSITPQNLVAFAKYRLNLTPKRASEFVARFMADLKRGVGKEGAR